MPTITKIIEQKRRPNRRNIYLDGAFAFGLNDNVVAQFRLREGMNLSEEMVAQIAAGEVRQECFDAGLRYLQGRQHSRAELRRKLMRREFGEAIIDGVLNDLARLGYVDDARFALSKGTSLAQNKHHGKRRAYMELIKAGVKKEVAEAALKDVYDQTDSLTSAKTLAQKKATSLKRLDPATAHRRLAGMLMRRGFDYQTIKEVSDEILGNHPEQPE